MVAIAARAEPPFDLIIEQQRGGSKQRLSQGYEAPKRQGRWLIHQRKAP